MTQRDSVPTAKAPRKLTYEEFLEWDGENQHVEWVNGKVIEIAPIGDVHQELGGRLIALLTWMWCKPLPIASDIWGQWQRK
jgi:Uma2 family endonuclease